MSTTRHLVNRRRRLAAVAAERGGAAAPPRGPADTDAPRAEPARAPVTENAAADDVLDDTGTDRRADDTGTDDTGTDGLLDDTGTDGAGTRETRRRRTRTGGKGPASGQRPRLRVGLPAVLCALTVLLGAFAAWAFGSAAGLRDEPARQNTALTDIGRTSEVKGRIAEAVGAVFSYNYAAAAKSERAARTHLVGKAVQQHRDMLAQVRAQGPKQKLVLTTTVTDSGVEVLDGDRARLLIFADQSNTRTGASQERTYAAAMFAVEAVRRDGTWRISAIDTFTQ
ncbi:hypothetical protein ACFYYY_14325 [Streptomyces sp. NPDC001834]|uniref:hypothetical protein n=1 Tax=unclassified Streptomyces TaxID=2593676 RepID=UPI003425B9D6